ncbi:hypothetical protein QWY82_10945 [Simiduia curdlanivorans]|uniref:Uncharacterized protein n=1 Tax=Simiduia curdlanivorans TaxID=1492769 RepID=A0ABV8VB97_9GAMM|nr:hypothetical protein [Simiduia curdlanivorans]MDN3639320.1 hypothetical protein [Simiduia curdlanivorans]
MIYRIHPDVKHYQLFHLDADQVEATLGEDCLIYMDSRPTHYLPHWKPLEIEFYDAYEGMSKKPENKPLPDIISDNNGKLFLSDKAYQSLKDLLAGCGEFLPVTCGEISGVLFNPLVLAEESNAVDLSLTLRDKWGNLNNLAFHPEKLKHPLFRTEQDSFRGVYCTEQLKIVVDKSELTGCIFAIDLADRPPADGTAEVGSVN